MALSKPSSRLALGMRLLRLKQQQQQVAPSIPVPANEQLTRWELFLARLKEALRQLEGELFQLKQSSPYHIQL